MSKSKQNKPKWLKNKLPDKAAPTFVKLPAANNVYPAFSHRWICQADYCLKRCSLTQFKAFADKIRILSNLDWKTIDSSPRTTNGYEHIPVDSLKGTMPAGPGNLKSVLVFRFNGGRIAGYREAGNFHILFIDSDFSLYDHGE